MFTLFAVAQFTLGKGKYKDIKFKILFQDSRFLFTKYTIYINIQQAVKRRSSILSRLCNKRDNIKK